MEKTSRIYIADHEGFFGSAIVRALKSQQYTNLILAPRKELDLMDQRETLYFFKRTKPEYVFLTAQRSGGILANIKYPADFLYDNLIIQTNVMRASLENGAKKLLFFGASCIYPAQTPQPIKESYLLQGPFEKTSEAYSIAKLAGIGLCRAYTQQYEMSCIPVVPATAYGPGASFDLEHSHVINALIRKFHDAKEQGVSEVVLWGTGTPRREFLYIDDLADACVVLMNKYGYPDLINIGSGKDLSIKELAGLVRRVIGYDGAVAFDKEKPDGVFQKLLDSSKVNSFGWKPQVALEDGLKKTYDWYRKTLA